MRTTTDILNTLRRRHPNQPEFLQAVEEVIADVDDIWSDRPDWRATAVLDRLVEPDRIVSFRVTWERDDGSIEVNRGWRVQFSNALGAYKGGLRFHPTVDESVLKFLGFEQCFKNALTGLPMGGAKGGSDFDPSDKSDSEIRRFCQAFMDELSPFIGPDRDVPAGDIGVGGREIGYLFGRYLKLTRQFNGALTGKPVDFGGSKIRTEATGWGAVFFLRTMLAAHDRDVEGQRVLISGAGNVALHAAERCLCDDMVVGSLSDSDGTLEFADGLTASQLERIKRHKKERGRLSELDVGRWHEGVTPWHLEGDVAMPCATENELDEDDARGLVERGTIAFVEGANMPLTAGAQRVVADARVLYAPGKAANAGGVAVSGLERTQNATLQAWSAERVASELESIMDTIHDRCAAAVDRRDGVIPYKAGANIAALHKLADTLAAYGTT